jgi:hypothetical protein
VKKLIEPACKCPGCSLWLRLEAERLDTSYKNPVRTPEPAQEVKPKTVTRIVYRERNDDDRDRLYFNAGRFAAGARDTSATRAAEQLREIEESNNDR